MFSFAGTTGKKAATPPKTSNTNPVKMHA